MWRDLAGAFSLLTILPADVDPKGRQPAWIFSYFPLVGLVIGGILWGVAALEFFSLALRAFMVLLVWVVLTGGLHLDGFADSSDGLLATAPPERRLEIMKDPRKGTWAVISLILLLLGKWLAIGEILDNPSWLILPPVMGRWAMVLAVYAFPLARQTGSAAAFRQGLSRWQPIIASSSAVMCAAVFGLPSGAVALVVPLSVLIIGRWTAARLGGGLTGDTYGMLCEVIEWMCLLVLGAM